MFWLIVILLLLGKRPAAAGPNPRMPLTSNPQVPAPASSTIMADPALSTTVNTNPNGSAVIATAVASVTPGAPSGPLPPVGNASQLRFLGYGSGIGAEYLDQNGNIVDGNGNILVASGR